MRFVNDPATEKALGTETYEVITRAVMPIGDCSACGQCLGSGTLRLTSNDAGPAVLVTAVHAACGTSDLQHGAMLGLPPATWNAAGAMIPISQVLPRRTWWGKTTEEIVTTFVPTMIVSPSCDVFLLSRQPDGQLATPVQVLFREGYARTGEIQFHGEALPNLTATLDGSELIVGSFLTGTYSIEVHQGFASIVEEARGMLFALTHEPIAGLVAGMPIPEELERVMTSEQSAFTWIPDHAIKILTNASDTIPSESQ